MVTGWFILQLRTAKMAGLKVDGKSFHGARSFLDSVECKGKIKGVEIQHRYGYTSGIRPRVRSTAIGCFGRQMLGWDVTELRDGVNWFMSKGGLPKWGGNGGSVDMYYWHWATLCAFQQGDETWLRWNAALRHALLPNQRKGGDEDGSWDPVGSYSLYWGRVGQTALTALCLEIYYRYPPVDRD